MMKLVLLENWSINSRCFHAKEHIKATTLRLIYLQEKSLKAINLKMKFTLVVPHEHIYVNENLCFRPYVREQFEAK